MAKKAKEIKPVMKFNVGLQKYELVLPLRKKKTKMEFEWKPLIILIIGLLILLGLLFWALKSRLI